MTGGLANGTRLIITKLMRNLIEAKVTTGPLKGDLVILPHFNHTPSDVENCHSPYNEENFLYD